MLYINRKAGRDPETVDEFDTRKEARLVLLEYQLSDPSADYYIATHPCKAWTATPN